MGPSKNQKEKSGQIIGQIVTGYNSWSCLAQKVTKLKETDKSHTQRNELGNIF